MAGKARILFVDDEKRVLNAMRGLFRREYELFLANSGAEAVDLATQNDIDVIVADQRMPGMTGVEVLAQVKQKSPRTVRILLTGYADPGAIEGSINVGEVFRFLSKPCSPQLLRDTLNLAVEASATAAVAPETATPPPVTARPPAPVPRENSVPAAPAAPDPVPPPRNLETNPSPPVRPPEATLPDRQPAVPHWQSVTNVVLSSDGVEESGDSNKHAPVTRMRNVGVVVFTVDSEFAATAIRAVSTERTTIIATTLIKVAAAIQDDKAGVLVTDFTNNRSILQKIITALKQQLPELITISVSESRDSDDMINLINYGQVFRYLVKPIDQCQLREDINAAVVRHLYLLDNPDAVKRHRVIETPKSTSALDRFFGHGKRPQRRRAGLTDSLP